MHTLNSYLRLTTNDPAGPCGARSADRTIHVDPNPTVGVRATVACVGNVSTATITATPSGGSGTGYSFAWTVPAGATNPGNVSSFAATVPGTYGVTVTDSRGCKGTGNITPTFIPCAPLQGCTPGYWKNHPGAWSTTIYSPFQTLGSVFSGLGTYSLSNNTLMQALSFSGGSDITGAIRNLLRAAVAALLNASSSGVNYPRTTTSIISDVNAAIASGNRTTILNLATALDTDNNIGCPLNNAYDKVTTNTPRQDVQEAMASRINVFASPNPYNDKVRFVIQSAVSGRASLDVYNMLGQKVHTIFNGNVHKGVSQTFDYHVPHVHRTTLFYIFRQGDETVTGKVLLAKQ